MSKFYGLPKPWMHPAAIPRYILAEGLERDAATTTWAPRGTIVTEGKLNGNFAKTNWATPDYILAEPTGTEARGTMWAPRGTAQRYTSNFGQARPERVTTPLASVLGQPVAAKIVAQVTTLPVGQRKAALKQILDALEPSLYDRVVRTTNQLEQQGRTPRAALLEALAVEMAQGVGAEMVKKKAPSLSGLDGWVGNPPVWVAGVRAKDEPLVRLTGQIDPPTGLALPTIVGQAKVPAFRVTMDPGNEFWAPRYENINEGYIPQPVFANNEYVYVPFVNGLFKRDVRFTTPEQQVLYLQEQAKKLAKGQQIVIYFRWQDGTILHRGAPGDGVPALVLASPGYLTMTVGIDETEASIQAKIQAESKKQQAARDAAIAAEKAKAEASRRIVDYPGLCRDVMFSKRGGEPWENIPVCQIFNEPDVTPTKDAICAQADAMFSKASAIERAIAGSFDPVHSSGPKQLTIGNKTYSGADVSRIRAGAQMIRQSAGCATWLKKNSNWAERAVDTVKDKIDDIMCSTAGKIATTVAGTAAGGPPGGAAASAASNLLCGGGAAPQPEPQQPTAPPPAVVEPVKPALPWPLIAAGAGAVLLIAISARKSK